MAPTDPAAPFWKIAEQFLQEADITEGTLMGFPCLRVNDGFFATADHRTGHLIVKLPGTRVQRLIADGVGVPFAPAGRVFREWVSVEDYDEGIWMDLMREARAFVASKA